MDNKVEKEQSLQKLIDIIKNIDVTAQPSDGPSPEVAESQKFEYKSNTVVHYSKNLPLKFLVKKLKFTDIPVLKSVQLSFFEKFTILLLQKGILADNKEILTDKISNILNVSVRCIKEFVDYLEDEGFLLFDESKKRYFLNPETKFEIKKEYDNAMFADLGDKMADCDSILLIEKLNAFRLEGDFSKDIYSKNLQNTGASTYLPLSDAELVERSREQLTPLFTRYFDKTNAHLKPDFTYSLKRDSYVEYQMEVDAIVDYEYNGDINKEKAFKKNVSVVDDGLLPKEFIDELTKEYDVDKKLPKFIKLGDSLYKKSLEEFNAYQESETNITKENAGIAPADKKIKEANAQLKDLNSEFNNEKAEIDKETAEIQSKINQGNEFLTRFQDLVDSSGDKSFVEGLKDKIRELTETNQKLNGNLENSKAKLERARKRFEQKEEELKNTISEQRTRIEKSSSEIIAYQKKQKELADEHEKLLKANKKVLHADITPVLTKYPSEDSLFNRYVSEICLQLDQAVSASEYSSFDDVMFCIDRIREPYKKVLQAVFETITHVKLQSVAFYFTESFNYSKLEDELRKRHVPNDVKNKVLIFHELANAIGHSTENGPKKEINDKRISDFKGLRPIEREDILLCVPRLFNSISLDKNELVNINKSISIL